MTALTEIHGKELSKVIIDTYWQLLKEHDDETCSKVLNDLIRFSKFWPKPYEFEELLKKYSKFGNKFYCKYCDKEKNSMIDVEPNLCMDCYEKYTQGKLTVGSRLKEIVEATVKAIEVKTNGIPE